MPGPHRTRQRCFGPVGGRPSASRRAAALRGGFDGTERAGTRSDGRKRGRNSAGGCGEDRSSDRMVRLCVRPSPVRRCRLVVLDSDLFAAHSVLSLLAADAQRHSQGLLNLNGLAVTYFTLPSVDRRGVNAPSFFFFFWK